MSRDNATLLDIAHAAQLIGDFIAGMSRQAFSGDPKTQSAVIYQLTIIGEAVKRLSRATREQHPQIPWQLIAGMRDRLIHGYDIVDIDQVWITATRDVPDLLRQIQTLLLP